MKTIYSKFNEHAKFICLYYLISIPKTVDVVHTPVVIDIHYDEEQFETSPFVDNKDHVLDRKINLLKYYFKTSNVKTK